MKFPAKRTPLPELCSAPESWVQPGQAVASRGALSVSKRLLSACERTAAVISVRSGRGCLSPAAFTVAAAQHKANIINHCFISTKVIKLYRVCTLFRGIFHFRNCILRKFAYLCAAFEQRIELWCNGNTADFGSVVPGSSPGSSTHKRETSIVSLFVSFHYGAVVRAYPAPGAEVFRCYFPDSSDAGFRRPLHSRTASHYRACRSADPSFPCFPLLRCWFCRFSLRP